MVVAAMLGTEPFILNFHLSTLSLYTLSQNYSLTLVGGKVMGSVYCTVFTNRNPGSKGALLPLGDHSNHQASRLVSSELVY